MGVFGHPSAWAIGRGMAMVSGVRISDLKSAGGIAVWPLLWSESFSTAPHALAAGVQITGLGTSVALSGQPSASCCSPAPEETLATRTKPQVPPDLAAFDLLKSAASLVSRSNFSG